MKDEKINDEKKDVCNSEQQKIFITKFENAQHLQINKTKFQAKLFSNLREPLRIYFLEKLINVKINSIYAA